MFLCQNSWLFSNKTIGVLGQCDTRSLVIGCVALGSRRTEWFRRWLCSVSESLTLLSLRLIQTIDSFSFKWTACVKATGGGRWCRAHRNCHSHACVRRARLATRRGVCPAVKLPGPRRPALLCVLRALNTRCPLHHSVCFYYF